MKLSQHDFSGSQFNEHNLLVSVVDTSKIYFKNCYVIFIFLCSTSGCLYVIEFQAIYKLLEVSGWVLFDLMTFVKFILSRL